MTRQPPEIRSLRLRVYDSTKRAFDCVAASVCLIFLGPLIGAVAVGVRVRLGSPVLFRQARPGRDGLVFELLKFRTMHEVDESRGRVSNEERMTRLGSFLRDWSLDELPSLWNIVRGDMSFVGPRPLLVRYLPLYNSTQARRHEVRPGLTGLAQVNGRNALEWERRLMLDVDYVDNRGFRMDLGILAKTVRKVMSRDGITSEGLVVGRPFAGTKTTDE